LRSKEIEFFTSQATSVLAGALFIGVSPNAAILFSSFSPSSKYIGGF